MSDQDNELFKKWNSWIGILDKEIMQLFSQREMFQELQEIIQQNPKIQKPSDFHYWVAVWHTTSLSLAVRRQCDNDKNVISYRRLLEGIKSNPRVLSRTRFISDFADYNYTQEDASEDFDKYSGAGQEFVDLLMIDQDISELEYESMKVKTYVDKRIAHYEKIEFKDIPSYQELYDSIEHLGQLHSKYYSLFRCWGKSNLAPIKQYDWTLIFHHPWIIHSSD